MRFVFHKPCKIADESKLVEIPKELLRDQSKVFKVEKVALDALKNLCESALSSNIFIIVISAFRTFEYQKKLFDEAEQKHGKGKGIQWLAPPGFSEHHTGYVFDWADKDRPETDDEQSFEGTPAFRWLSENAKKFGFELSFSRNNWQGVGYEPWHWRFVGNKKARAIFHPNPFKKTVNLAKCIISGILFRLRF